MNEMYIKELNGWVDAYQSTFDVNGKTYQHAIKMGDGFMTQLCSPLNIKEAIENNCRLKNGVRRTIAKQCYDARDMSLTFQISANSREDANAKMERLYTLFYQKTFDIAVDGIIYHLTYLGQNGTFAHSASWSTVSVTAKFRECDPTDRDTYEIRHGSFVVTGKKKPTFVSTYHVTISYDATQCTLDAESGDYDEGAELTITVTPKSGYKFSKWVVNDKIESKTDNPRTFIIKRDTKISVLMVGQVTPTPTPDPKPFEPVLG